MGGVKRGLQTGDEVLTFQPIAVEEILTHWPLEDLDAILKM